MAVLQLQSSVCSFKRKQDDNSSPVFSFKLEIEPKKGEEDENRNSVKTRMKRTQVRRGLTNYLGSGGANREAGKVPAGVLNPFSSFMS